jgi:hypothetical protein
MKINWKKIIRFWLGLCFFFLLMENSAISSQDYYIVGGSSNLKQTILKKTFETYCGPPFNETFGNAIEDIAGYEITNYHIVAKVVFEIYLKNIGKNLIEVIIIPLYFDPFTHRQYLIIDPDRGVYLKIVVLWDKSRKVVLPAEGSSVRMLEYSCFGKNVR